MTNIVPTISAKTTVLFLILLLSTSCLKVTKQYCGPKCRKEKEKAAREAALNSPAYLARKQQVAQMAADNARARQEREKREADAKAAEEGRKRDELRAAQDRNFAEYRGRKEWNGQRNIIIVPACPHRDYDGCQRYLADFYHKYGAHNCNEIQHNYTGPTSVEAQWIKNSGMGGVLSAGTNAMGKGM